MSFYFDGPPPPCYPIYTPPPPPTRDDLVAVFPEFTSVPAARVNFQLQLAAEACRPQWWQDRWFNAVLLYAAHYLATSAGTLTGPGGSAAGPSSGLSGGVVSSKSVGGVSKSYNTSLGTTEGGGSFNTTVYGQQYLTMRDSGAGVGIQL